MGTISKIILLLSLCALPTLAQAIEPAPEYENLFQRTSGWTGADGTYSFPINDGRTLWGFSDTFFGDIVDGTRAQPFRFVNNSLVVQDGPKVDILEAPIFTPPRGDGWFWLFDGIRDFDRFEILLGQFDGHGDGGFGFRQTGLWVADFRLLLDRNRAEVLSLKKLPFFGRKGSEQITFGPAILETDSWLYLYGAHDLNGGRYSVLARTPKGHLADAGAWRFYDGQGWSEDMWQAKSLFEGAAMEASVHPTRSGQYLYIGTDVAGMSSEIIARLAPSPEGPWSTAMPIHSAPEHAGDVFTYNAKAHPELSLEDRILISYNVNTSNLTKVVDDSDIYRPRFFWWTPPRAGWLPAAPSGGGKSLE